MFENFLRKILAQFSGEKKSWNTQNQMTGRFFILKQIFEENNEYSCTAVVELWPIIILNCAKVFSFKINIY
jgi:hypothetical protein